MSSAIRASALEKGRVSQKIRTRNALLDAAYEMLRRNDPITVASVANAANISTATAYRYFPDAETIQIEAIIRNDAGRGDDYMVEFKEKVSAHQDPIERVVAVHNLMMEWVRKNEAGYRLFIAKRHERIATRQTPFENNDSRNDRRLRMITLALEPIAKSLGDRIEEISLRIAAVIGPEPYFTLKDVCGIDDQTLDRLAEANLRQIVRSLV